MWENAQVVTANVLQGAMWWRSKKPVFLENCKAIFSTKCKNKNKIILRENNCLVSDPIAVADIFNTYFVNIADGIGKDIDGKIPPDYENDESLINMISKYDSHPSILAIKRARQQCCPFQFSEVMYDDVYSLLVNLDPKKATGYDNIPSKLLKVGSFSLAGTLCKLINFSITECKFPDILKFAEVSAQYKKIWYALQRKLQTSQYSCSAIQSIWKSTLQANDLIL